MKKVLITGGSRGIGKATAIAFLKNGDEVLILSRDEKELEDTKKELSAIGSVEVAVGDVSNEADVQRVREWIEKKWGSVDVLVNAAGIYGPIGPVETLDLGEWKKVIDVNLTGTFLMTKHVVPMMKKAGHGKIVNFVGGGEGAFPSFTGYVSSKGAITRFNETVAAELQPFNIQVNAIFPGAVNTKFLDEALAAGPEKTGKENYDKFVKQKEVGGVPPERAADLILFLASEKADGITGRIISAVWDNYPKLTGHLEELKKSDVYTMRRVKPEHRGLDFN